MMLQQPDIRYCERERNSERSPDHDHCVVADCAVTDGVMACVVTDGLMARAVTDGVMACAVTDGLMACSVIGVLLS
jgi:hypothetical protein